MPVASKSGIHFSNPGEFLPYSAAVADLLVYQNTTARDASTTAFFTEMDNRGVQDQTNWTADTYKTILSVASGKGLVAAYYGCTGGGSETHTIEITVDGVVSTIAVPVVSGSRACLTPGLMLGTAYTTANFYQIPVTEAINAAKTILTATVGVANTPALPTWGSLTGRAVPLLKFSTSLLIRAKHSVSITNSTATAYSGVMYRNFLA